MTAIAAQILGQMSAEDIRDYTPAKWREGVGNMLRDEWEHFDLDDVLIEIDELIAANR